MSKVIYDTSAGDPKRYEVQWRRPDDVGWTHWSYHGSLQGARCSARFGVPTGGFVRIIDHEEEEE